MTQVAVPRSRIWRSPRATHRRWAAVPTGAPGLGSSSVMRCSLEPRLRRHVRVFLGQVAFLTLLDSPTLLVDRHPPLLFLMLLRIMFALTALVLLIAGLFANWRRPEMVFDLWDHCLAFFLLALGCSIALRLLG